MMTMRKKRTFTRNDEQANRNSNETQHIDSYYICIVNVVRGEAPQYTRPNSYLFGSYKHLLI